MRIVLRENPNYPFFYTIDKVISVSQNNREQVIDESKCSDFHYRILKEAEKKGIITIVKSIATPVAEANFTGCPYSYHKLRRAIDIGEVDVEAAREYLEKEKKTKEPRVTIIRILETYISLNA